MIAAVGKAIDAKECSDRASFSHGGLAGLGSAEGRVSYAG
jgi:hypothetical protein